MSKIIIRDVKPEDNSALYELVQATLKEFGACGDGFAGSDAELLDMCQSYQDQGKHYFVVEKDGKVLGGAGVAPLDGDEQSGVCELRKMYFFTELRGQGVGKKLIDECIEKARNLGYKSMYLETLENMRAAQKLYLSRDFEYIENRMGDTGHHGCPVFMLKNL